jgi:RNA polymerase sigma-70 factor (ECF subfamily)
MSETPPAAPTRLGIGARLPREIGMPLSDLSLPGEKDEPPKDGELTARILAEVPVLRRHAQSLLYSRADAEDLVQDCLETALQKAGSLQDPGRLRGWLFSILNNLFLMRLRREARRGRVLPIEEFADSLAASVPPADRDRARDLARAMGRLSAEHRQILLLINLEGQSYQEAAEALGVPIGTVMSRLARARQRLRAVLQGDELRAVD